MGPGYGRGGYGGGYGGGYNPPPMRGNRYGRQMPYAQPQLQPQLQTFDNYQNQLIGGGARYAPNFNQPQMSPEQAYNQANQQIGGGTGMAIYNPEQFGIPQVTPQQAYNNYANVIYRSPEQQASIDAQTKFFK
jgi:hypothetical protein